VSPAAAGPLGALSGITQVANERIGFTVYS